MSTVKDIENALFAWAPKELAESWDNVGQLVGNPEAEVKKVLVSLDVTDEVVDEAIENNVDLIVAHHPIMNCKWDPVQSVKAGDPLGDKLIKMIKNDIAGICMHTNLDAADGGVNDVLAKKLGLSDLEMLSEEKIGRVGVLNCDLPLVEFARFVVESLGCNGLRYKDCGKKVHKVAVGGGACGEFAPNAIAMGCDTFVTSDLKYHAFLDEKEINLIDAGHFPTEDLICEPVVEYIREHFPQVEVSKTKKHVREIIQYYIKEN